MALCARTNTFREKEAIKTEINRYQVLGVIALLILPGFFIAYHLGQYVANPSAANPSPFFERKVEYKNHITGLNLGVLEPGNYTYQTQITNPHENITVRVYSFLFSDPEGSNASLACSVKNGTMVLPLESVYAFYDLTVYSEAEYYIRVGCLKEGEDY